MKIKCGNCGKNIIVPDDIVAGQHVRCPYCDVKSKFDKPSRVELPECFEVKRRARTKVEELKKLARERKTASETETVAELPVENKPKLAIRRPPQETHDRVHMNAAAAAVDARIRRAERGQRMKKAKKLAWNVFGIIVLTALAWIGYSVWRAVQQKDEPLTMPECVTDLVEEVAGKVKSEQEPVRTDESEALRQAEERQRAEAEAERQRIEAARAAERAEQLRKRYGVVTEMFKGAKLSFWKFMPKEKRPGAADGVTYALISHARQHQELYEITTSNHTMFVRKLLAENDGCRVPTEDFEKSLNANGGLFASGPIAYAYRAKGTAKKWNVPIGRELFDPAKAYFGEMAEPLAALSVDTSGIAYEVNLAFGDEQPQAVSTVSHGRTIPAEDFRRIVEARACEIQRKRAPMDCKVKRFRPTVVFYDGAFVSRGMNGVTKVPRNCPRAGKDGYAEWSKLCREAKRQESELERSEREAARMRAEWQAAKNGPADAKLVEELLVSGSVTVSAKVGERSN